MTPWRDRLRAKRCKSCDKPLRAYNKSGYCSTCSRIISNRNRRQQQKNKKHGKKKKN